jgi:hypothetical protein
LLKNLQQCPTSSKPKEGTVIVQIYKMHYPVSHTESTKEVVILLTAASSVSGAEPRSKASMYFVHKVATQGQFRTALAYTFHMTDAT